jgi:hypothetical protein
MDAEVCAWVAVRYGVRLFGDRWGLWAGCRVGVRSSLPCGHHLGIEGRLGSTAPHWASTGNGRVGAIAVGGPLTRALWGGAVKTSSGPLCSRGCGVVSARSLALCGPLVDCCRT